MAHDRYLGDGVYASFDGYNVWLAVNHHENKVVALEPSVLNSLISYAKDLRGNAVKDHVTAQLNSAQKKD